MKKLINKLLSKAGYELRRTKAPEQAISLKTDQPTNKGCVLLAYIIDPFLEQNNGEISTRHTHYYESTLLAKAWLDLGYDVDVINYRSLDFEPQKDYVFYINARDNFQRIGERLNPSCVKIVHLDTSHFVFNNHAAYQRSVDLLQRRGVAVASEKLFRVSHAIEYADYATVLGNDFTVGTYSFADKKIFKLPVPTPRPYEWNEQKDFDSVKTNFIWLGSSGLLHKGLDLVLEAFIRMPEFKLRVCGPIDSEPDFVEAYRKELYDTPNIETVGWVDTNSRKFEEILDDSLALVYPSCAEGQSGAVITCLQAGLIPLVSYQSGVDVHDFGEIFEDNSIEKIVNHVQQVASRPADQLREMAHKAWWYARENHTGERYLDEYREIVGRIIEERGNSAST
jgi:glycosyltransferase involved in cell wall biosynthesis